MQQLAERNPARERGLRRARRRRAACPPIERTPIPAPADAATVLALQTRVRAARIAGGELSPSRLHDLRAFKTAAAELAYLHRLAHTARNGTVVTSMPQLVKGLARLHPAWRMTGDRFDDRDRHQTAVRRRLRDLDAMGLLAWRIGVDTDGEDARTELQLRQAPDVTHDELVDARAQLARWRRRYGTDLNTGSATGIRGVRRHAAPLTAQQRRRRGQAHAIARAQARRHPSRSNTAPLSEAPAALGPPCQRDLWRKDRRAPAPAGIPAWLAAIGAAGARAQRMGEGMDAIMRAAAPSDRAALGRLRTASVSGGGLGLLRQAGRAGCPADLIALAAWAIAFPGLQPCLSTAVREQLRRSGSQYDRLVGPGAAAALLIDLMAGADVDARMGFEPRTLAYYAHDLKAAARALRRHARRAPPARPHRPRGRP